MRLGKIIKYILIIIPLLLVAVVVGAIAVLMNMDFNQYKPLIAEEAKKATGRDLVIAGDLSLEISLNPAIAVNGVTLSNAKWGARPEMVKVERFEARMALLPLVFGVVEVKRIVLIGADILLEVDKKGRANFVMAPPGGKPPKKEEAPAAAPEEAEDGGIGVIPVVREVEIRDSLITFTDAKAGAKYKMGIESLVLTGGEMAEPIGLAYAGSYNEASLKIDATLGAPAELLAPTRPWPVDLTVRAGGATITVKGTIAEPTQGKGLNLAVTVKGDQLGDLSKLAGAEVPPIGAYSLSTKVTGNPASTVKLTGFKAALGGSDLAGDITAKLSGKRPLITATLASRMIDLTVLGAAGGGGADGGGADQPAARKSDKVFPSDPLPLDGLKAVDANLKFSAKTIIVADMKLTNANIGLSLKGGNLVIKPLKAVVAEGALNGSVNLDGRKKAAGLVVKMVMEKVNLDRLLTDLKITEDVEGKANINIDIAGRGKSVAAIMASLGGRVGLLMGQGRMKDTIMQTMLGGAGGLLNQVLDKGKSGYTMISCAVVDFAIKKGLATSKALYMDTDTRGIIGGGTANLGKETLNLTVDPRKKKSMGKSVLPVRITGTFAAPKYGIDKQAAAAKLTKLFGAQLPPALTGGQSSSGGTPLVEGPCAPPAPAAAAPQQQPAAQETQTAPVPTEPADALKGAEEQLKKGLKGLFGN